MIAVPVIEVTVIEVGVSPDVRVSADISVGVGITVPTKRELKRNRAEADDQSSEVEDPHADEPSTGAGRSITWSAGAGVLTDFCATRR